MRSRYFAAGCILALSACTGVPNAEYFPPSSQRVVASASHWQIIAKDAVAKLAPALGKETGLVSVMPRSASSDAIMGVLATALTDRGVAVARSPRPGMDVVHVEMQAIGHGRDDIPHAGTATLLGIGGGMAVWAIAQAVTVASVAAPAIGLGLGATSELLAGAFPASPNTEVVLSVTLTRNGADVARSSGVYYVSPGDEGLYQGPLHPVRVPVQ